MLEVGAGVLDGEIGDLVAELFPNALTQRPGPSHSRKLSAALESLEARRSALVQLQLEADMVR